MAEKPVYRISQNKEGKWQVKKDGSQKALRVFDIKVEAINYAKATANNQNGIFMIDDKPSTLNSISNITQNIKKVSNQTTSKPDIQAARGKTSKRRKGNSFSKILLTIIVGMIVGMALGFVGGKLYSNGVNFELLGYENEEVKLNEEFVDPGFIATYDQMDISEYVTKAYKKTNGEEVVKLDTSIACSYLIIYTLNYQEKNINISLVRIITVDLKSVVETDSLSIHFLELGNKYTGDCVYIKAGDSDILIDAGSRKNSAAAITNYVNQYCTDGVLEYVIATHAHQDHIAGFVGTTKIPGIFDAYECEVIIDYARSNSTSSIRRDYESLVQEEVDKDGAVHYTALECWNEESGARRKYDIADGITLSILYNYYYENDTNDENDYSVCILISEGDNHYLFTGDLEEAGEKKLVQYNNLPEVKVFKAGHHGSSTSSSNELLEVIKPEIVCICCCAGSTEYTTNSNNTFPTQGFISRIRHYTDKIYVTTIDSGNEFGYESFNGTIVVFSTNGIISVNCTNNNIILKDTDWFKTNRKWE